MRKLFVFVLLSLGAIAMMAGPAFACDEDAATTSTLKASQASGKAGCGMKMSSEEYSKMCGGKGMKGTATSIKADLTESSTMSLEECAKLMGMSPEECAKMCGSNPNCTITHMSVKGMTCGGCEQSVTASLETVPGVLKVIKVSHQDGIAVVCSDPTKFDGAALTKAVADKGFEAMIMPAMAKTVDGKAGCAGHGKLTGEKTAGKTCGMAKSKKTASTSDNLGSSQ